MGEFCKCFRRTAGLQLVYPDDPADEAWAAGWTGKGVSVGVLDTGVDTTHPGFGNRLTAQEFMDREGFYYNPANRNIPYDPWNIYQAGGSFYLTAGGHGTAVAGLIGGYLTTPLTDGTTWTYKGIAYESLLKVGSIRDNPKSSDPGYPYSGFGINTEVLGETGGPIDWLLARGVRVINNSWGSTTQITDFNLTDKNPVALGYLEQKTLDGWRKAVSSNVLIVFSAGNDGGSRGNFSQPSLEAVCPTCTRNCASPGSTRWR
jgi:subtilase-type serine protease